MPDDKEGCTEARAEVDHEVHGEAKSVLDLERQVLEHNMEHEGRPGSVKLAFSGRDLTEPGGSTPWPPRRVADVDSWRTAAFTRERPNTVILGFESSTR